MRVLLVEDHEPFRQFVRTLLETQEDLELVGESGDGLDAVRKCLELQPDVVLMDIGLPGLNGIEAARRILASAPAPKVIFLTLERATEIAQEAFNLGAAGYVIKAQTASDLIPAILSARDGRHALRDGIKRNISTDHRHALIARAGGGSQGIQAPFNKPSCDHQIHFYPDEPSLVNGLAHVMAKALQADKAVIAILTERHRLEIIHLLESRRIAVEAMRSEGRFICLDAAEIMRDCVVNGRLDAPRMFDSALEIIESLREAYPDAGIVACGEGAGVLCAQGHGQAAVQMEKLWDAMGRRFSLELFCAYLMAGDTRSLNSQDYQQLLAVHSSVTRG